MVEPAASIGGPSQAPGAWNDTIRFSSTGNHTPNAKVMSGQNVYFESDIAETVFVHKKGATWALEQDPPFGVSDDTVTKTAKKVGGKYWYEARRQDGTIIVSGQIEIISPDELKSPGAMVSIEDIEQLEKLMVELFEQIGKTATAMEGQKVDKFFPNGIERISFAAGFKDFKLEFSVEGPEPSPKATE